jgi:hypothetical protein
MAIFKILDINETGKTAWLAGIIDSEGSIELAFYKPKLHRVGIVPRARIINQNKDFLDCAKQVAGLRSHTTRHKRPNGKDVYDLLFSNQNAIKILSRVKPYLIVKRKHAQIILDWANYRRGRPFSEPYSQKDLDYCLAIRRLQKKTTKPGAISKTFLLFLEQIGIPVENFDFSLLKKD